jgi:multiple sugar transport system ATP-binding protein
MANVVLKNIAKRFGDVVAVNDVNLEIADREFVVLVGPSAAVKPPHCFIPAAQFGTSFLI